MCGILVVFSKKGEIDQSACHRALGLMTWRGPDIQCTSVFDDQLFFGQTILSITGFTRHGQGEHLHTQSNRYHLVFNGEVYNFKDLESRFLAGHDNLISKYGSDSEVLLNIHEIMSPEGVIPLLDGMFAYVVYDERLRDLHICRDVQGEKSLYIYEDEDLLVVSTEVRAILSLVPNIPLDPQAFRDYFHTRHLMLFDRTVYKGIRIILPGYLKSFHLDSCTWSEKRVLKLSDWIEPARMHQNEKRSIDDLADELDWILSQCVRQMFPEGQRYAVVVSGGVDSSLLAHYFVENHVPNMLVAINHKEKDRISSDLSGFERTLGAEIETIHVDVASYAAEISRCQGVCGSPLNAHSFVPQSIMASYVRASGCRVIIGGEGGDEYFGGYEAYLKRHTSPGRFSPSPYTTFYTPKFYFADDNPLVLQQALHEIWAESLDAYDFIENEYERFTLAMMFCDAAFQLPAVGLRGADLMSTMWSVEPRSVYVRKPVVQFALNLPAKMKVDRDGRRSPRESLKPVLKRLFLRYFPGELLFDKQGFAGFPNESARFLGDISGYLAGRFLGIEEISVSAGMEDRDSAWKLINVEYFLRNHHV